MRALPALAAVACLASGCLRLESTLTLEDNGTGRLEIQYTLPDPTITQMQAVFQLQDDLIRATGGTPEKQVSIERILANPDTASLRRALRARLPKGVTLEQAFVDQRRGNRRIRVTLAFNKLATLAASDLFKKTGMVVKQQNDGSTLVSVPPMNKARERIVSPTTRPEETTLVDNPAGDLRVQFRVRVNGRIHETSAHRRSRQTISWVFDQSTDERALVRLQNATFTLRYSPRR
jgi:hypothetical protein